MLTIALATRGRPQLLLKTLRATVPNIHENDTELVVIVDNDDMETKKEINSILKIPYCYYLLSERVPSLGAKYNKIIQEWAVLPGNNNTRDDAYLAMVDYTPILTPAFDSILLDRAQEFPDGIGILLSDKANLTFSGLNAWTSRTVGALGYLYPPYFPYWFLDHWIEQVGWMANRVIHVPIQIDRSERPGTQNKRDFPFWINFWKNSKRLRELDAQKLINEMDTRWATWNKASWPLIHQHGDILYDMMLQDYQRSGELEVDDSILHASLRAQANQLLRSQQLS